MAAPEERAAQTVTLLISELGPWQLAFGADRVEVVSADAESANDERPPHDLAQHLGQSLAERSAACRTLSMITGSGRVRISVPARLWVETVAVAAVIPLPAFVARGLRQLGVEALVSCEAGLAFVMDVDRLASCMSDGEAA